MSRVQLITSTPNAEKSMAYIARVSNPRNQDNDDFTKLIGYCIKNEHWSVFEQAYMTLQIETTRGIAAQILRHRSFTFQEFSQRYADSMQLGEIPIPELRRQDNKNRQNSISDLPKEIINTFNKKIKLQFDQNKELYEEMWLTAPSGDFYDAYKLVKSWRDALQKAFWVNAGNPNKAKLVAALNKMINDPESVTAIEKKVGKYDWRTGADGDAAVRTLKSFITPKALKTLADFKSNQLGYNTVYKKSLTE